MNNTWKPTIYCFVCSIICYVLYIASGVIFDSASLLALPVCITHFTAGYFFVSKTKGYYRFWSLLAILAPFTLVILFTLLFVKGTLTNMLCIPIAGFLFLWLGLLFTNRRKIEAYTIGGLCMLLYSFWGAAKISALIIWLLPDKVVNSNFTQVEKFYLHTPEGELIDNRVFKNKVVIFDFWASYCAPCFKAMPDFEKSFRAHQAESDVIFVSLNIKSDKDKSDYLRNFTSATKYTFPIMAASDSLIKMMGVNTIPHYAVFSKEGKLIFNGSIFQQGFNKKIEYLISMARKNQPVAELSNLGTSELSIGAQ